MNTKNSTTKKLVAVDDVRPGMFVVGLDRSWLKTPFLLHRKLIQSGEEIDRLKQHGIREVVIDTTRGADVSHSADVPVAAGVEPAIVRAEAPISDAKSAQAPPSAAESAFEPMAREIETARAIHDEALSLAQAIFDGAGGGAPIDGAVAGQVVANLLWPSRNFSPT